MKYLCAVVITAAALMSTGTVSALADGARGYRHHYVQTKYRHHHHRYVQTKYRHHHHRYVRTKYRHHHHHVGYIPPNQNNLPILWR
jgi:hypothetical protein